MRRTRRIAKASSRVQWIDRYTGQGGVAQSDNSPPGLYPSYEREPGTDCEILGCIWRVCPGKRSPQIGNPADPSSYPEREVSQACAGGRRLNSAVRMRLPQGPKIPRANRKPACPKPRDVNGGKMTSLFSNALSPSPQIPHECRHAKLTNVNVGFFRALPFSCQMAPVDFAAKSGGLAVSAYRVWESCALRHAIGSKTSRAWVLMPIVLAAETEESGLQEFPL